MSKTKFLSQEQKEVCKKTLELMPFKFSTAGFIKGVQMLGTSDLWINKYQCRYFLLFYAKRIEGSKSWTKNIKEQNTIIPTTSSNSLNFHFEEVKEEKTIIDKLDIETKDCLECGNQFEIIKFSPGHEKKYCSIKCRTKAGNKRKIEKIKLDAINIEINKEKIIHDDINQAIKTLVDTGMYKIYLKTEEFKQII
jgi:hypothetical protein